MDTPNLRLITIPFSHYCEKARWALEHHGLPFEEEAHAPIFHMRATLRVRARRTVPVLVTPEGVLPDSTDILLYADRASASGPPLYPEDPTLRAEVEALEDRFDVHLGPATRRLVYFHLLPDGGYSRRLLASGSPAWQGRLIGPLFPLFRALMRRGMKLDAAGAARSRQKLDELWTEVDARLADGRRYLVGERFSAADLTFASLAAPILLPPEYGVHLPTGGLPASATALVEEYRNTAPGRFALRLYAEERRQKAGGKVARTGS